MGLTRKVMSLSTLGAVDFRSDKERTAAYTKATKKQTKKQTKLMKQQAKLAKRLAGRLGKTKTPGLAAGGSSVVPVAPVESDELSRSAQLAWPSPSSPAASSDASRREP